MTSHAYPAAALIGDYGRAGLGLVFVLPPLFLVPPLHALGTFCFALAVLFLAFAGRTLMRQLTPLEMDESGIVAGGPWPRRLDWGALDGLSLHYYTTRRDREDGWMQLALRGQGHRLRLDSRIEGFDAIAARAACAAEARRLPLSPTTLANLTALGLAVALVDEPIEVHS